MLSILGDGDNEAAAVLIEVAVASVMQTSSRAVGEVALPRAAEGPGRFCMLLCRCAAFHYLQIPDHYCRF